MFGTRGAHTAVIAEPGVRLRAERFYQQLDLLEPVRQEARRDLLSESRKHPAVKLLRQIPSIGPIRAALLPSAPRTPRTNPARRSRPVRPNPYFKHGPLCLVLWGALHYRLNTNLLFVYVFEHFTIFVSCPVESPLCMATQHAPIFHIAPDDYL